MRNKRYKVRNRKYDDYEYIEEIVDTIHEDLSKLQQSGKYNAMGQELLIKEIKDKVCDMVEYAFNFGEEVGTNQEKYRQRMARQKQNYFSKRHIEKQTKKKIVSILKEYENENEIPKEILGKIMECLS